MFIRQEQDHRQIHEMQQFDITSTYKRNDDPNDGVHRASGFLDIMALMVMCIYINMYIYIYLYYTYNRML
jgi:hypothetical protein